MTAVHIQLMCTNLLMGNDEIAKNPIGSGYKVFTTDSIYLSLYTITYTRFVYCFLFVCLLLFTFI